MAVKDEPKEDGAAERDDEVPLTEDDYNEAGYLTVDAIRRIARLPPLPRN